MSKKNIKEEGLGKGGLAQFNNIQAALNEDIEVEEDVLTFARMENDSNVKLVDLNIMEDAPLEWNFYKPLPDAKFQSMKDSIVEDGLFHPILIWEIEEGTKYMILSGHNRRRAFAELLLETEDNKYSRISAKVIRSRSMTKQKAKAIVSMGNYAQRNVSSAEEFEALKSIYLYNKEELQIKKKRENYTRIEEITGKNLTTIKRILNLGNLIPDLYNFVCEGKQVSWVAAQKLVPMNEEDQQWLYDNYKDKLSSRVVKNINSSMERDDIRNLFEDDIEEFSGVDIFIPKDLESEVKKLIKEWEKANLTTWKYQNSIK